MRAHSLTLSLPYGTTTSRSGQMVETPTLAFTNVAYHRRWPDANAFTVTHIASTLAVATDLPSLAAARSLAIALETDVAVWPRQNAAGAWVDVASLSLALRDWRRANVGGYAARRASR